jgi:hypothetical protein
MKTTIKMTIGLSEVASQRLSGRRFSMSTPSGDDAVREALKRVLAEGAMVTIGASGFHSGNLAEAMASGVCGVVEPIHSEVWDTDVRDGIRGFIEGLLDGRMEKPLGDNQCLQPGQAVVI